MAIPRQRAPALDDYRYRTQLREQYESSRDLTPEKSNGRTPLQNTSSSMNIECRTISAAYLLSPPDTWDAALCAQCPYVAFNLDFTYSPAVTTSYRGGRSSLTQLAIGYARIRHISSHHTAQLRHTWEKHRQSSRHPHIRATTMG